MFKIEAANNIVLIDPWLDGNPTSPIKASEVTEADIVIPKHYKTFPVLAQSADEKATVLAYVGSKVWV